MERQKKLLQWNTEEQVLYNHFLQTRRLFHADGNKVLLVFCKLFEWLENTEDSVITMHQA